MSPCYLATSYYGFISLDQARGVAHLTSLNPKVPVCQRARHWIGPVETVNVWREQLNKKIWIVGERQQEFNAPGDVDQSLAMLPDVLQLINLVASWCDVDDPSVGIIAGIERDLPRMCCLYFRWAFFGRLEIDDQVFVGCAPGKIVIADDR